jgi:hypothetical protein
MRISELPKWAVPAACSAVAFGVGAAVGCLLTKRQYKVLEVTKVEETQLSFDFDTTEFDRELGKATYTIRKMRDESENLASVVRDLAILKDIPVGPSRENHPSNHQLRPEDIEVELELGDGYEVEEVMVGGSVVHVFAEVNIDEDWDYEIECSQRRRSVPYVIHRDEFFGDEMGYLDAGGQRCFTWYAGDNVLVDENDKPIYNPDQRVGELKWGHGSQDPNLVYIRNEGEEEEYEIVMDDGAYQVVVLGGQIENDLEHMDFKHSRAPGKFRDD